MDPLFDVTFLTVRWIHAIAATIWLGGAIFYSLILTPLVESSIPFLSTRIKHRFHELVLFSMGALLITGVILTAERLSQPIASNTYVAVLALKVSIVAWMFMVVATRGKGLGRVTKDGRGLIGKMGTFMMSVKSVLVLGPVVFFISDVLRYLVEKGLDA